MTKTSIFWAHCASSLYSLYVHTWIWTIKRIIVPWWCVWPSFFAHNLNFQRTKVLLGFTIHTERHQFYWDQGIMVMVYSQRANPMDVLLTFVNQPNYFYQCLWHIFYFFLRMPSAFDHTIECKNIQVWKGPPIVLAIELLLVRNH